MTFGVLNNYLDVVVYAIEFVYRICFAQMLDVR